MRAPVMPAVAALALSALVACTTADAPTSPPGRPTGTGPTGTGPTGTGTTTGPTGAGPTGAEPTGAGASAVPFTLYTHCGIDEAYHQGRWYEAVQPLSDGSGNPPAGWGNPTQRGTMRVISATEAEFRHPSGQVVGFRLRPDATGPKRICS
ncbi:hypothetical protein NCC78_17675 [Micromonospora phytophila]|uniref:hypothetical protein n=1 Tax=Micromonospora phytophila TaxID=709888 RepID=UPI00202F34DE|nr:hypothetical protein [Micromonospora phytophila]MCM0676500.1 hypothetical protein [Micromonospora phytophila]